VSVRIRPAGDRALLICPAEHDELPGVMDRLRELDAPGVEDLLPAAETVLVTLRPEASPGAVEDLVREALAQPVRGPRPTAESNVEVTIPVRYDGEDLADVAALLDCSVEDVIEAHTSRTWRCRFIGFTAGFGYLDSEGSGLVVPRRDQSRTAVPAGAVALADGYSAVYPRRAPGGWQLIGTTDLAMFDLSRPEPALLGPGTVVRFVREDS
jgi:KipI family sensor histidine kinase inhibitor